MCSVILVVVGNHRISGVTEYNKRWLIWQLYNNTIIIVFMSGPLLL